LQPPSATARGGSAPATAPPGPGSNRGSNRQRSVHGLLSVCCPLSVCRPRVPFQLPSHAGEAEGPLREGPLRVQRDSCVPKWAPACTKVSMPGLSRLAPARSNLRFSQLSGSVSSPVQSALRFSQLSGSVSSPVQPDLRFSPSDSDWRTARWARRPVPRRSVPSRHQIQPSESVLWARLLSTSPIHGRICLLKPLCPDEAGGLASWVGHHRSGITGVVAGGTVEPVGRAGSG
jgi:hypothetical protein